MPDYTPNIAAPLWASEQASPWLPHNQALRIFDAFAVAAIVESRGTLAPPGSCADGARYLIDGVGSGAWLGHNGELAIAVGANASNGWYFAEVALEGVSIYIRDEPGVVIRYVSGVWAEQPIVARLTDLIDVNTTGLADGLVLKYDASNGFFYFATDLSGTSGGGSSTLAGLSDVTLSGLADGYVLKYDLSNGLFYFAPDINDISLPFEVSAATYNLDEADRNKYIRFTNAGDVTVNVRAQATHALTLGGDWHLRNGGGGFVTLVPAGTVLINPPAGGTKILEPGGTATLKNYGVDAFDLIGQTLVLIS